MDLNNLSDQEKENIKFFLKNAENRQLSAKEILDMGIKKETVFLSIHDVRLLLDRIFISEKLQKTAVNYLSAIDALDPAPKTLFKGILSDIIK